MADQSPRKSIVRASHAHCRLFWLGTRNRNVRHAAAAVSCDPDDPGSRTAKPSALFGKTINSDATRLAIGCLGDSIIDTHGGPHPPALAHANSGDKTLDR